MQIAIYARVSTPRQYENAISVPDQFAQMRRWAKANGHTIVKEYEEPGKSATDDNRLVFQMMMNDAAARPAPFQMIVVHSFSRFFRNMIESAIYQRKLAKLGITVESITQHTSDDTAGQMQRHMIMLFDEYQSKEIAKHVLRGMQENARQGYFNGSKAPFGYKTYDAGQTGFRGRYKKKLEIEPAEAEIVKGIYELYVKGKNAPRIGMKEIAKTLNAKGITMRGKPWSVQKIFEILGRTTYAGFHTFNRRDHKKGIVRDKSEWIKIPVPAIIDQETYSAAEKLREANAPKKSAPRRESSPTLLAGLIRCGHCGSHMVVATGKSGQYRYYKCSKRMGQGNAACPSRNIPLEKLDSLVLDAFRQKVYTPEHIRDIIDALRKQSAKMETPDKKLQLKKLEAELAETEQAQTRLFDAIEKGLIEQDDQLKDRFRQNKAKREGLLAEIVALKQQKQSPLASLTPQKIEAVARILNRKLSESLPFAKAYLKASLDDIRVTDDFVSLSGANTTMANLVANNGQIDATASVPRFIPEWWAR